MFTRANTPRGAENFRGRSAGFFFGVRKISVSWHTRQAAAARQLRLLDIGRSMAGVLSQFALVVFVYVLADLRRRLYVPYVPATRSQRGQRAKPPNLRTPEVTRDVVHGKCLVNRDSDLKEQFRFRESLVVYVCVCVTRFAFRDQASCSKHMRAQC